MIDVFGLPVSSGCMCPGDESICHGQSSKQIFFGALCMRRNSECLDAILHGFSGIVVFIKKQRPQSRKRGGGTHFENNRTGINVASTNGTFRILTDTRQSKTMRYKKLLVNTELPGSKFRIDIL